MYIRHRRRCRRCRRYFTFAAAAAAAAAATLHPLPPLPPLLYICRRRYRRRRRCRRLAAEPERDAAAMTFMNELGAPACSKFTPPHIGHNFGYGLRGARSFNLEYDNVAIARVSALLLKRLRGAATGAVPSQMTILCLGFAPTELVIPFLWYRCRIDLFRYMSRQIPWSITRERK